MNENIKTRRELGLYKALNNMFDTNIIKATSETKKLHGGTVGEVLFIEGIATTATNEEVPYKLVHKIQKQWKRHLDPDSWLREYDLYQSNLDTLMSDSLRWPICYYSDKSEDEVHLWMEFIDGVTGDELTLDMFEVASKEIGRFQGKLLRDKPAELDTISNLSRETMIKEIYHRYASWTEVYDYIRREDCELPNHICQMIIDNDEKSEELWTEIEKLPIIFSHRDFWVTNIIYLEGRIGLIDWDTTGWGSLGEDIASLIIDETAPEMIHDYYKTCIPAYIEGLSEFIDMSNYKNLFIFEQILLFFGYRLVEDFKFTKSETEKKYCLDVLEKLAELNKIRDSIFI